MPEPGRPRRAVRAREGLGHAVTVVLREIRLERGMTRAELAHGAQVSAQTLAKIEQGHSTDPGFTTVAAVAQTLGLPLDDLVERARDLADRSEA
jgi:transcriptional regulator with XRE-family HTH domain